MRISWRSRSTASRPARSKSGGPAGGRAEAGPAQAPRSRSRAGGIDRMGGFYSSEALSATPPWTTLPADGFEGRRGPRLREARDVSLRASSADAQAGGPLQRGGRGRGGALRDAGDGGAAA